MASCVRNDHKPENRNHSAQTHLTAHPKGSAPTGQARPGVWMLLCAALLLGVGAAAGAATGCPCIDVSGLIAPNGNCTYGNAANPLDARHCYLPMYGSSTCAAHDAGLEPSCASNPLSYCAQQWCYVDAAACALTTYSTRRTDAFPSLNIFYSYETCGGSEVEWTSFTVTQQLSMHTLRMGIPALYYPQHFKYDALGAQVTKFGHANHREQLLLRRWRPVRGRVR